MEIAAERITPDDAKYPDGRQADTKNTFARASGITIQAH